MLKYLCVMLMVHLTNLIEVLFQGLILTMLGHKVGLFHQDVFLLTISFYIADFDWSFYRLGLLLVMDLRFLSHLQHLRLLLMGSFANETCGHHLHSYNSPSSLIHTL